jgi:hypothetical protein
MANCSPRSRLAVPAGPVMLCYIFTKGPPVEDLTSMSGENDACDAILRRFPGPVILYRSRWKRLVSGLGCFVLTLFSLSWALSRDPQHSMGLLFAITLGAGTVGLFASAIFPKWFSLTLDEIGFTLAAFPLRKREYRWTDVADFHEFDMAASGAVIRSVAFNAVRPQYFLHRHLDSFCTKYLDRFNVKVTGGNEMLPEQAGLRADEMVQLLSAWQKLALGQQARRAAQERIGTSDRILKA